MTELEKQSIVTGILHIDLNAISLNHFKQFELNDRNLYFYKVKNNKNLGGIGEAIEFCVEKLDTGFESPLSIEDANEIYFQHIQENHLISEIERTISHNGISFGKTHKFILLESTKDDSHDGILFFVVKKSHDKIGCDQWGFKMYFPKTCKIMTS